MESKFQMSLKTKKILVGIGIGFGTILTFIVSFVLAVVVFSSEPVVLFSSNDPEALEETEKLKEENRELTEKVEYLESSVERYKSSAGGSVQYYTDPQPQPQQSSTPSSESVQSEASGNQSTGGSTAEATPAPEAPIAPDATGGDATVGEVPDSGEAEEITVIDITE